MIVKIEMSHTETRNEALTERGWKQTGEFHSILESRKRVGLAKESSDSSHTGNVLPTMTETGNQDHWLLRVQNGGVGRRQKPGPSFTN